MSVRHGNRDGWSRSKNSTANRKRNDREALGPSQFAPKAKRHHQSESKGVELQELSFLAGDSGNSDAVDSLGDETKTNNTEETKETDIQSNSGAGGFTPHPASTIPSISNSGNNNNNNSNNNNDNNNISNSIPTNAIDTDDSIVINPKYRADKAATYHNKHGLQNYTQDSVWSIQHYEIIYKHVGRQCWNLWDDIYDYIDQYQLNYYVRCLDILLLFRALLTDHEDFVKYSLRENFVIRALSLALDDMLLGVETEIDKVLVNENYFDTILLPVLYMDHSEFINAIVGIITARQKLAELVIYTEVQLHRYLQFSEKVLESITSIDAEICKRSMLPPNERIARAEKYWNNPNSNSVYQNPMTVLHNRNPRTFAVPAKTVQKRSYSQSANSHKTRGYSVISQEEALQSMSRPGVLFKQYFDKDKKPGPWKVVGSGLSNTRLAGSHGARNGNTSGGSRSNYGPTTPESIPSPAPHERSITVIANSQDEKQKDPTQGSNVYCVTGTGQQRTSHEQQRTKRQVRFADEITKSLTKRGVSDLKLTPKFSFDEKKEPQSLFNFYISLKQFLAKAKEIGFDDEHSVALLGIILEAFTGRAKKMRDTTHPNQFESWDEFDEWFLDIFDHSGLGQYMYNRMCAFEFSHNCQPKGMIPEFERELVMYRYAMQFVHPNNRQFYELTEANLVTLVFQKLPSKIRTKVKNKMNNDFVKYVNLAILHEYLEGFTAAGQYIKTLETAEIKQSFNTSNSKQSTSSTNTDIGKQINVLQTQVKQLQRTMTKQQSKPSTQTKNTQSKTTTKQHAIVYDLHYISQHKNSSIIKKDDTCNSCGIKGHWSIMCKALHMNPSKLFSIEKEALQGTSKNDFYREHPRTAKQIAYSKKLLNANKERKSKSKRFGKGKYRGKGKDKARWRRRDVSNVQQQSNTDEKNDFSDFIQDKSDDDNNQSPESKNNSKPSQSNDSKQSNSKNQSRDATIGLMNQLKQQEANAKGKSQPQSSNQSKSQSKSTKSSTKSKKSKGNDKQ